MTDQRTPKRKQVWLHVGKVDNADAYPEQSVKVGDLEFQFSDGPVGQRSSSADYVGLGKGLDDHYDCDVYVNLRDIGEAGLDTAFQLYQWLAQEPGENK
jgi:hypothetical protein